MGVNLLTHGQVNITNRRLRRWSAGDEVPNDVPPPLTRRRHTARRKRDQMMLWPAVTLLGFLALTALVIAMGTQSTARYEREQQAAGSAAGRAAAETVGAARAA
jgi:hypothetical protein